MKKITILLILGVLLVATFGFKVHQNGYGDGTTGQEIAEDTDTGDSELDTGDNHDAGQDDVETDNTAQDTDIEQDDTEIEDTEATQQDIQGDAAPPPFK